MKTPEELAKEHADKWIVLQPEYTRIIYDFIEGYNSGFKAGYKSGLTDKTEEAKDGQNT